MERGYLQFSRRSHERASVSPRRVGCPRYRGRPPQSRLTDPLGVQTLRRASPRILERFLNARQPADAPHEQVGQPSAGSWSLIIRRGLPRTADQRFKKPSAVRPLQMVGALRSSEPASWLSSVNRAPSFATYRSVTARANNWRTRKGGWVAMVKFEDIWREQCDAAITIRAR